MHRRWAAVPQRPRRPAQRKHVWPDLAPGPHRSTVSCFARHPVDAPPVRSASCRPVIVAGLRPPPAEIAARAGHSVRVLLTTHAHCIPGHDQLASQQIGQALRTSTRPAAGPQESAVNPGNPVRHTSVPQLDLKPPPRSGHMSVTWEIPARKTRPTDRGPGPAAPGRCLAQPADQAGPVPAFGRIRRQFAACPGSAPTSHPVTSGEPSFTSLTQGPARALADQRVAVRPGWLRSSSRCRRRGQDGQGLRRQQGRAEALDHPAGDQLARAGGQPAGDGGQREHRHPGSEHGAWPAPVTQPAVMSIAASGSA